MAPTPSSQDLEIAAHAIGVLRARGAEHFSPAEFRAVARARATDPAEPLLAFLEVCDLLACEGGRWCLSAAGREVFDQLGRADWGLYARALLGSGAYDGELARLIEGAGEVDGALRCPLGALPRLAPQAGVLLAWDPGLRDQGELVVPLGLIEALLASASMERAAELPGWVGEQGHVGWRAELYSLRLQRCRLGPRRVLHVSHDVGDGFGYDIETTATDPSRYIEVKGSRSARVSFIVTARELSVARLHPERYEIHFWGEISFARRPSEEYGVLRERGFPIVISDPAATIEAEGWTVEPRSWRVRQER